MDGKFEFKGSVVNSDIATLQYDGTILAQFILENSKFTIDGEMGSNIEISGGKLQMVYSETDDKLNALVREWQNPATSPERGEVIIREYDELQLNTFKNNLNNIIGVLYSQMVDIAPDEMIAYTSQMPVELQNHPVVRDVIARAEALRRVEPGNRYVNIVQPDPDGNEIDLADVLQKNKYVLIDFWAAWCGPCLAEIPYMVKDYAEYHHKGFEIYAVSLDHSRDAWLAAISDLELDWLHVGYVRYWDNPACKDYAVTGIPANFLVSSDGIIVARNLRGEALGAKLAELLP
jgi:thiol-disulfide isomerase/thioredoxin